MPVPNIELFPEPMQKKSVTFLRLAPSKRGAEEKAQVSLLLKIKNLEPSEIELEGVKITILGPSGILFGPDDAPPFPAHLHIASHSFGFWHTQVFNKDSEDHPLTLTDETINRNIIVPSTANIIKFGLSFHGFDLFEKIFAMRPHRSPTDEGAYSFPGRASELRWHEFWSSSAAVHGQGRWGSQLFALDIGIVGWDQDNGGWSGLLPGKSGEENADYRIWGKPVYAMADGEAVGARWDFPDNQNPRKEITEEIKALIDQLNDGSGNFVLIATKDEFHAYCHLMFDSVPDKFRSGNVPVEKGDFLGLTGNSGNSSGPHLHLGVLQKRRVISPRDAEWILRPMPLTDAYTINSKFASGNQLEHVSLISKAPWFKNTNHGLNYSIPDKCLVWPGKLVPGAPRLVLKEFACFAESDAEFGNESPYFVILVGRRFAGTVQSRVIRVRKEAWDGTVVGNGLPVTANHDIIGNLDTTAFVLVALMEEDNDVDLAGDDFSTLRTTMRKAFQEFAVDESLSLEDIEFLLKPRFISAINEAVVNDECLGVERLKIDTLDGILPSLLFTGDGAEYRVQFEMQQ